jgi:hypothetical protein
MLRSVNRRTIAVLVPTETGYLSLAGYLPLVPESPFVVPPRLAGRSPPCRSRPLTIGCAPSDFAGIGAGTGAAAVGGAGI